ncbi:hypothetical protein EYR40_007463 [Pleurotus pulmonarius]|nr:hypothetical protein EYR40_007463 [Pleurotus pulmonarius]
MLALISGFPYAHMVNFDAGQRVVYVDANFWLAEGVQVLGCLRYFNKAPRIEFDPEDAIPCVIEASVAVMNADAKIENLNMDENERKEYHFVGDITWIIPVGGENLDLRCPPYIYAGGVVKRSTREIGADYAKFDLDCSPWLYAFRHDPRLSRLPVRTLIHKNARFPDLKKVCPAEETWVFVSGRLSKCEKSESSGWVSRVDIDLDTDGTVDFMGKWSAPFTPIKTPGNGALKGEKGTKRKFSYDSFKGSPIPFKRPIIRTEKENLTSEGSMSSVDSSNLPSTPTKADRSSPPLEYI